MTENIAAIAAAMSCLDDYMAAFNGRDIDSFEATFNFPAVGLASNAPTIIERGHHTAAIYATGRLADWSHSTWDRRDVIRSGADKVHIDTRFTRYRADGSVIGTFDCLYVVTRENGHWGVKARIS
jgi:hypothetical protein